MSALALDRQSIEKKDFPISRRGYEPEAVDMHLASLAGEVERLEQELDRARRAVASAPAGVSAPAAAPSPVQSLALAASEQVRLIVDAAETSGADIERVAQEEAARIRADADAEARRVREEAVGRSQDQVGKVGEATSTMLQRMDAMESELGSLLDGLRTGTSRLTADLSLLQGNLGDLYGAAGSSQAPAPPRAEPTLPVPAPAPEPVAEAPQYVPEPPYEAEPEPEVEEEPVALAPAASVAVPEPVAPEPVETVAAPTPVQDGGDVEGARLIALNMALNGQSRAETEQYLGENFDLADRAGLLDEVYATVEG